MAPTELVEHAVSELRRGSAIVILAESGPPTAVLVRAAEAVDLWPRPYFDRSDIGAISLAVTGRRTAVLGFGEPAACAVRSGYVF